MGILFAVLPLLGAETNAVPSDCLVLRRLEWIPQLRPRLIPALPPAVYPVAAVEDLATARARVWASVRVWGDTNLTVGRGRLWSYDDTQGRFQPVQHAVRWGLPGGQRERDGSPPTDPHPVVHSPGSGGREDGKS